MYNFAPYLEPEPVKFTGMKKIIINITMLLSVTIAALSCSTEAPFSYDVNTHSSYTIIISGTASDKSSSTPLEGIRISLYATEKGNDKESGMKTKAVYTDSKGYFALSLGGFSKPAHCTIMANDPEGIYETVQQDINISWNGTSFDEQTGCFYVNSCDFYMDKIMKR